MVLVKIEPKEAVRFIKLRQSFPHSWDMGGTSKGEDDDGEAGLYSYIYSADIHLIYGNSCAGLEMGCDQCIRYL